MSKEIKIQKQPNCTTGNPNKMQYKIQTTTSTATNQQTFNHKITNAKNHQLQPKQPNANVKNQKRTNNQNNQKETTTTPTATKSPTILTNNQIQPTKTQPIATKHPNVKKLKKLKHKIQKKLNFAIQHPDQMQLDYDKLQSLYDTLKNQKNNTLYDPKTSLEIKKNLINKLFLTIVHPLNLKLSYQPFYQHFLKPTTRKYVCFIGDQYLHKMIQKQFHIPNKNITPILSILNSNLFFIWILKINQIHQENNTNKIIADCFEYLFGYLSIHSHISQKKAIFHNLFTKILIQQNLYNPIEKEKNNVENNL